jgi:glutathione peroxidase
MITKILSFMKFFFAAALTLMLLGILKLFGIGVKTPIATEIHGKPLGEVTIYDFTMKDIQGNDVSLADFKGKVVLCVNVASKCGLTPQYESLEALYKSHKDKGLVILGFPANNFMGQEPGTEEEIATFCKSKYDVSFPMFGKISVKGEDIHPLYQYLTQTTSENVKWNFQKFLVNKEGKVVKSISPKTAVSDKSVIAAIEEELAK